MDKEGLVIVKKRILIRIDDVCPTMDGSAFWERINFFKELGIKPLLGVIPACEDETLQYGNVDHFWEMIRDLADEGYPIAMHGCRHVYTMGKRGLVCLRKQSEFVGLPYETQVQMLQAGKRMLEEKGINTRWFMAPGHSYDRQTVRALAAAGFQYVSDGRSSSPYCLHGIKFIPAASIWQSPFCGKVVTVCMHPSTDSQRSYRKVQKFVRENRSQVGAFSEAEQWSALPYALCRIDELVRLLSEKAAVYTYDKIKELWLKIRNG